MQESAYRALHMPKKASETNCFVLQPGSVDNPYLLVVPDFDNLVYMGKGANQAFTIPAYETALDLVHQWRDNKNMPDDAGVPGIWLHPTDQPSVDEVLASQELREYNERQMQFASSKVREARLFAASNEWRNITKLHLFMGKLLNVQGEPWQDFDAKASAGKVRCPYCDTPMAITAAICGQCREICNLERYNQIRAAQGLLPKAAGAAVAKPS
jgi:hypothetical protein